MEEVKVVKIFTSQDNLQAEMILDTLKQNGIPAYKKDADESGFMNIYGGNSMCGEEIYVADINVGRARQVLEGIGLLPEEE